ncbi:FtsK/SpoIIIE domain-containing protein [Streptomyces sp. NBC_00433]
MRTVLFWLVVAGLVALMVRPDLLGRLPGRGPGWLRRLDDSGLRWYVTGFPVMAFRMVFTWRSLCVESGLTVTKRSNRAVLGGAVVVAGRELRPGIPRLGVPQPTPLGLRVRIRMRPGQTPADFLAAAEAMAHAWHAFGVRVASPRRGWVVATVTAADPLLRAGGGLGGRPARLLSAVVGRTEEGGPWRIDFRAVPHWLVIGATRSGKSVLMAALVFGLAPQPVALVGIDCKGGMELSLFGPRLSALACTAKEAVALLGALVAEMEARMAVCQGGGARSVWELPEDVRPVPVVLLVDEIAELYLTDGSREGRQQAAECSMALLRLAQLGAALGVHLIVAGQRFGSELGQGVTALRAQLGGRICHRVNDPETALMVLGDLAPDAVAVAQSITETEQGVAVITDGGSWVRARSTYTSADQSRQTAHTFAKITPALPGLVHAVEGARGAA